MNTVLAIVGASYLQKPLVEKAKEMGLYTICFAWEEGAVCKEIVDEFYPISIVDKESILTVCREKHITGICTIASDVAAPTVAYVANSMNLIGNDYSASVRANNKGIMRKAFKENGIPCPWFQEVSDVSEVFLEDLQFPLIVKPVDRSGSLGVSQVNNVNELKTALEIAIKTSFTHRAMVEQYISGREISVEFISYKGNHYPLQITDKVTTGAPHFVELEHHQPSSLSNPIKKIINDMTTKALNAIGITNGASHTEYKITEDGQIYIIELGGRMGGDFIGSDLVKLSTGYDFVQGVIDVALGQFKEPKITMSKYSGVFFVCKETEYLLSLFDDTKLLPYIVKKGINDKHMRYVTCSADRSGFIIYQNDKRMIYNGKTSIVSL